MGGKIFGKPLLAITLIASISGCSDSSAPADDAAAMASAAAPVVAPVRETPRFDDGTVNFDQPPGEIGYWGNPSQFSLVENGVSVAMNEQGLLDDINDADKVAPFMPWSLGLYKYRQANGLADDPVRACISPAGPRHLHYEGGFRMLQDRNFERVYVVFGGGNRGWRVIFLDGREPPDPEEVAGTYYGNSTGHWDGDTLVVESSGFNDRFWFSNGGLPHTPALSLVERFTRPDFDTLVYDVEINDPRTYTRPWTASWTLEWIEGEIEENFCEQVEAMDQYTGAQGQ